MSGHLTLDCDPFDYYVWSAVELETSLTANNTNDELTAKLIAAFTNSNKETI